MCFPSFKKILQISLALSVIFLLRDSFIDFLLTSNKPIRAQFCLSLGRTTNKHLLSELKKAKYLCHSWALYLNETNRKEVKCLDFQHRSKIGLFSHDDVQKKRQCLKKTWKDKIIMSTLCVRNVNDDQVQHLSIFHFQIFFQNCVFPEKLFWILLLNLNYFTSNSKTQPINLE